MKWDTELYEARHSFVWQYGEGLVDLLAPKAGERILDVGCGTGHLSKRIADFGAEVVGVDAAPEMVGQARQNYPKLTFALKDCSKLDYADEFDAVFSNAALHWILDAQGAARSMTRALKRGGRLVVEFGGKGNVQTIENAIISVISRYLPDHVPERRTYYPSISEYTNILEGAGMETQLAQLFNRLTSLDGTHGMQNWIRQFCWYYFEGLPVKEQTEALDQVLADLRPKLSNPQGWHADYRRLRIVAVKL